MKKLRANGPAVMVFFGGIALWEIVVRAFSIQGFILPAPSAVVTALIQQRAALLQAGIGTFLTALGGLVLGAVLAVAAAMAAVRWAALRDASMTVAIAANSTPIIVLAPVANSWFGILSPWSGLTVVAVLVFFPIMINLVKGLLSVSATQLELMHSYGAPDGRILRSLRTPSALPFLFSALRVAAPLSLIGAIVKEYFGGSQERLGQFITSKASLFQFEEAWAAIVVASAVGILFYRVIAAAERRIIPWHASMRSG